MRPAVDCTGDLLLFPYELIWPVLQSLKFVDQKDIDRLNEKEVSLRDNFLKMA